MSNLLPCPFCGGEEINLFTRDGVMRYYWYECAKCYCGTGHEESEAEAIAAWNRRAQPENEPCTDCTGIVYRQTASGKIIPADQKCAAATPPCYQPDGDGCAYQTYGDNDDEPIDKCKECPLCLGDKARRAQPSEKPLTLDELRQMDGEPVWVQELPPYTTAGYKVLAAPAVNEYGDICFDGGDCYAPYDYGKTWLAYRRKPERSEG